MNRNNITEAEVKDANRRFYDAIADRYEELDGRRSPRLRAWLREGLSDLRRKAPGGRLLDLGTGSGVVTRCAEGLFDWRVGTDISPRIIDANQDAFDRGVVADVTALPFEANSFDVVTCFAVLHHLYTFDDLVSEVHRVLKPGGIFYSDHDMDSAFNKRFRLPLLFYRGMHNAAARYCEASEEITQELYDLAEHQKNGIDLPRLLGLLEEGGFLTETRFHWYGLTGVTDCVFGKRAYARGWGPLVSVEAVRS